eukprot:TRINITY_DN92500_c0_g1_i1.p1 TRINITY_DN92500_c0_g1~~TRINITY_DN92500_c0_g1_i1.p1  ORF type:complete len:665 (-),score=115.41 TRINITY_DN92500_c0_g1_i1:73-1917(-)
MSHVATHLDHLLQARLEQTQDVSKLLDQLRTLAYNFVLQSTKLLLLSATTFKLPDSLHSLDSLQLLRRTAFSAEILPEKYDKDLAKEMVEAWQTDSGRLLRTLLEQEHCVALVEGHEGREERTAGATGLVLEVQRAEALPSKSMDVVDPFVKVKVVQGKTTLSSSKTSRKKNSPDPVWNEAFFLDVPSLDSHTTSAPVNITLDIVDYNGSVMSPYTFACAAPVDLPSALDKAGRAEDIALSLSAVAGTLSDPRDVSKSRLFVRFRFPDMTRELKQLRRAWPSLGADDQQNSGLKFPSLGPPSLDAAEALDHATYFLDIAVRRAREVTRLLGDLGAVLLAPVLCALLDEVEQRVMAAGRKAEALNEAVAVRTIESERRSHTCVTAAKERLSEAMPSRPSKVYLERVQRATATSLEAMHQLEHPILTCCSDIRRQCQRYQGITGVLDSAKRSVSALRDCLAAEETQRRSSRFAKSIGDSDSHLASGVVEYAELMAGAGKDILSAALVPGKTAAHASGYPGIPGTGTTKTLPGTTCTSARTPEGRTGSFKQGDKVHVWSESRQTWMTDAIVLEVGSAGFVLGGKPAVGALRIKSAAGEKWVLPEQIPQLVRFELFRG